jgi:TFIIF-interacting CTD phosphatase-like protein
MEDRSKELEKNLQLAGKELPKLNPEFNQAIQGKKEWIAKNISGVNEEIFVPASQKSSFATSKHILIDDMQKNIDAWRAAGGKAILHTSSPKTIEALKKYNL